jgi:CheY-like chemotaxis protein
MKKILICEDEEDMQQILSHVLQTRDLEVYSAHDGREAVKKTKSLKPDLIVLDIRMPKLDGIEVAKAIRKFDRNVKIIFMTAFQSQEIQNEASKYNIIAYLNKSTPTEEIIKTIEESLK